MSHFKFTFSLNMHTVQDFLGSPVVKTLPCNAGNTGLIPGLGTKIPHAEAPQLLTRASIRGSTHLNKDLICPN